jgi:gluconolactonase
MTAEIRDARFRAVIGDDAALETLGTGFLFTEGPVWHPRERHLTFSDMPGDHMRRWTAAGGWRPSASRRTRRTATPMTASGGC